MMAENKSYSEKRKESVRIQLRKIKQVFLEIKGNRYQKIRLTSVSARAFILSLSRAQYIAVP